METLKKYIPGMAVCLGIAVPSWLLGKLVPVIGGPVFSIVIGMVIALFWTPGATCRPGIGFTSKKILHPAVFGSLHYRCRNCVFITGIGMDHIPFCVFCHIR